MLTWWFGVGWLFGWWLLWRLDPPGSSAAGDAAEPAAGPGHHPDLSTVSVVIPARNESDRLAALLDDLDHPLNRPAEVVVVDDESTDSTAAIAAERASAIVASGGPPPGWTGKAWACWLGAQRARGRILVFLDADVRLAPGALQRVCVDRERAGGLLSVQPYHLTEQPYEQLSLYFNLVGLMAAGEFTPRRMGARAAFGPCMVCARDDYVSVGGHAAARGEVVEDLALARCFLEAGLPVRVAAGRDDVRFRMYPGGIGQMVEGWTKNMAIGAAATSCARLVAVVVWIGSGIAATILAADAMAGHRPRIGATSYGLTAVQLGWMARRAGRFRWWAIAGFPGPLVFFLGVFARSVAAMARGQVTWRGRTIAVGRQARVDRTAEQR